MGKHTYPNFVNEDVKINNIGITPTFPTWKQSKCLTFLQTEMWEMEKSEPKQSWDQQRKPEFKNTNNSSKNHNKINPVPKFRLNQIHNKSQELQTSGLLCFRQHERFRYQKRNGMVIMYKASKGVDLWYFGTPESQVL